MRHTLRLLRPGNVALAAAGTWVGALLAHGWVQPSGAWWLAAGATATITAFGNVLNDLRDERLDRSAHPDRPLPQGYPRVAAWRIALAAMAAGLALAAFTTLPASALALLNVTLLVAYELALKPLGLAGNAAVAFLVGSTIAFGSLATGGGLPTLVLLAALLATLANLGRELLKDLEDEAADLGHRLTFPMRHGSSATRWAAATSVGAAVVLSGGLAALAARGWATAALAAADVVLLAGISLAWTSPGRAQRVLKVGMALALAAFALLPPSPTFS